MARWQSEISVRFFRAGLPQTSDVNGTSGTSDITLQPYNLTSSCGNPLKNKGDNLTTIKLTTLQAWWVRLPIFVPNGALWVRLPNMYNAVVSIFVARLFLKCLMFWNASMARPLIPSSNIELNDRLVHRKIHRLVHRTTYTPPFPRALRCSFFCVVSGKFAKNFALKCTTMQFFCCKICKNAFFCIIFCIFLYDWPVVSVWCSIFVPNLVYAIISI